MCPADEFRPYEEEDEEEGPSVVFDKRLAGGKLDDDDDEDDDEPRTCIASHVYFHFDGCPYVRAGDCVSIRLRFVCVCVCGVDSG